VPSWELRSGFGARPEPGRAGDFQYRSGLVIHLRRFHQRFATTPEPEQHGRPRRWSDDVFLLERLWPSVRNQVEDPGNFPDGRQLCVALENSVPLYNDCRPHQPMS